MINDLKELQKLFKLCRAQGITEIKLNGVEFKMGDLPREPGEASSISDSELSPQNPYANFPQGELTPEQLIFYSSGGKPDDDPELKDTIQ